jgi:hypothetical protein
VASESDKISSNINMIGGSGLISDTYGVDDVGGDDNDPETTNTEKQEDATPSATNEASTPAEVTLQKDKASDHNPAASIVAAVERLEELADTAEDFLEKGLSDLTSGITSFFSHAISITPAEPSSPALPKRNIV